MTSALWQLPSIPQALRNLSSTRATGNTESQYEDEDRQVSRAGPEQECVKAPKRRHY